MKLNTCPDHPGRVIEAHPCPKCGYPARPPRGREPYRVAGLRRKNESEEESMSKVVEVTVDDAGHIDEQGREALAEARPDFAVIDRNTGEELQLSLLGAQWEDYKVSTLRLSLSGGEEFIKSLFDQIVVGELTPGAIVEVVARGTVKEHAPIFTKGLYEAKTVILLQVIRGIQVLHRGPYGSVEPAQNVDGEAKILEEAGGHEE